MDEEEKLLYGLFLNSGVRDAEMQNTEYADFNLGEMHAARSAESWRKFRLKGKSKKKSSKDRFIPIPAADAGSPMGFQSIFAWKALPEAAFVKKAVIDAHRSKHESIASG
jgi:hypothetical protein